MPEPVRIWSEAEQLAAVDSYMNMLKLELSGIPFNKSAENERLRSHLDRRTKGAVEFKHQNISSVLAEIGWIYIFGYKPMKNIQSDLRNAVETYIRRDNELDELAGASTTFSPTATFAVAPELEQVDPPETTLGTAAWIPRVTGIKRDYLYRDTRNRALGLAGELSVVQFESNRLLSKGRPDLARRVEHVSLTQGDGLGYDVLSFESDGRERFVEVKTTLYSIETPFFVSANEVEASDFYGGQFHVQRVFNFKRNPKIYTLVGSLQESCNLAPESFRAWPKGMNTLGMPVTLEEQ